MAHQFDPRGLTASVTHPAAFFTNLAAPATFNAATQQGNLPIAPQLTVVGTTYTFNNGAGGLPITFNTHPALSVTTGAVYSFNATSQALILPLSALNSFWQTPAGTFPDGTTDDTESIRRTGNVGLNVAPLSTLDVAGSHAVNYTASSAAAYSVAALDSVVDVSAATAQVITLPAAASFIRRIIILRNSGALAKSTASSYIDSASLTSTNIPAHSTLTLQSNGSAWLLLDRSVALGNVRTPVVYAEGRINIGDPIPVGARPILNGFNITTATGVAQVAAVSRLQIGFTNPLPSNIYTVNGELVSQAPAGFLNDATQSFIVTNKTVTGFEVAFREATGVVQNLFFDFVIQRNI